jgi:hypothetical protein
VPSVSVKASGDYGSNPWAVLWDALVSIALEEPSPDVDCITQATVAVAELMAVGVNAEAASAFATRDGDASSQDAEVFNSVGVLLDFFLSDGETINSIEGFYYLRENNQPTVGYTVVPNTGPFQPYQGYVEGGLPAEAWKRLAFSAMYETLLSLRQEATPPRGGQQWWVQPGPPAVPFGSVAVPFPVSIP